MYYAIYGENGAVGQRYQDHLLALRRNSLDGFLHYGQFGIGYLPVKISVCLSVVGAISGFMRFLTKSSYNCSLFFDTFKQISFDGSGDARCNLCTLLLDSVLRILVYSFGPPE